jgi:hypothetical protein
MQETLRGLEVFQVNSHFYFVLCYSKLSFSLFTNHRERTLLMYLEKNSKGIPLQIERIVEEELTLYRRKHQFEDALSLCEQILNTIYKNDNNAHPLRRAK